MITLFDYIFYRVYKFYQTLDNNPDIYASGLVALIQFLTLIDIMFLLNLFFQFKIPWKFYFIPVLIILMGINWYRYENNLDIQRLEDKWGNEDNIKKKNKGLLILIYIGLSVLIPILIGTFKNSPI